MKELEYYMSLPYQITFVPDMDEGGYGVYFPELPGCISCGETLEEAYKMAQDAKKCWLESALMDKMEIPQPTKEHFFVTSKNK